MSDDPFAVGFRLGITQFDTIGTVTGMDSEKPNFAALAEYYKCSERTLRRWHKQGVNVCSPLSIAAAITEKERTPEGTLERLEQALEELTA